MTPRSNTQESPPESSLPTRTELRAWISRAAWFVSRSLYLDIRLLLRPPPAIDVTPFLLKKYALLLRHMYKPFRLGHDHVTLSGQPLFYDSRFGLAAYQSILTRTSRLLDIGNVNSARVVIDVGANVGFFTLMSLHRFPRATILSIEPVPETFRVLSANTQGQSRVSLANIAISDQSGQVNMSFSPSDSAVSRVIATGTGAIPASTLDEIAQQFHLDTVDLLKIDTEAFEAHVLRGAQEILRRTRYLLIEITVTANHNYTVPSLLSLLCDDRVDWQLVALRNFADKSEGEAPILDCLFENRVLKYRDVSDPL